MQQALYHFLNGAGGLTHDPKVWEQFARSQASAQRAEPEAAQKLSQLTDAAEQLRRLSRNARLTAQESRLLSKALAIVEDKAGCGRQPA